jgi:hypothetical protein
MDPCEWRRIKLENDKIISVRIKKNLRYIEYGLDDPDVPEEFEESQRKKEADRR